MRAIDVANFFIKAGSLNEGTEMTNARINKLLFFAQGWHMALYNKPLFEDDFQAWTYGPVIPSVYRMFNYSGRNTILETPNDFSFDMFSQEEFDFLMNVFVKYLDYSTNALITLTHRPGSPWSKTKVQNEIISKDAIKEYFKAQLNGDVFEDFTTNIPSVSKIIDGEIVLPEEYDC